MNRQSVGLAPPCVYGLTPNWGRVRPRCRLNLRTLERVCYTEYMPDFAAPVERLIDELKHLPGIGQKTAQRLAFHLLRASPEDAMALADAIRDAKQKIRECTTCG